MNESMPGQSHFNHSVESGRTVPMPNSPFPRGSSHYINTLNKIKVLNLIRERGGISRADLAKKSGISAPTITRIVDSLIREEGLVRDVGEGVSSGGRKPVLLEFAGLDNFVIGIDLGSTSIYGVLANLNAEIIADVSCPTGVGEGFALVMKRTREVITELLHDSAIQGKRIFGIGIAVAGLINRYKNVIEYSPDFHWRNADIIAALQPGIDIPIIFDNVTRVMALGERCYAVGSKVKNFIVVNIGYGIGAGIIIDGKPFYGPRGMAGEFGHITLEKNSPVLCECGNHGCLEALASGRAIAEAAREALENGTASMLTEMCGGQYDEITAAMVAEAANRGDRPAQRIFYQAAEYIGIGISGLVNLFSPEMVIIGGGVAQAGDLLFDTVRHIVAERSMQAITRNLIIRPASFGSKAAVMGAVALILNEVLHLNHDSGFPRVSYS